MDWKNLAKADEVKEGASVAIIVKGRPILLSRIEGVFYAIDAVCTHKYGYLPMGSIENACVICPAHLAGFDVRTGRLVKRLEPSPKHPDGIVPDLNSYQLKVEEGEVKILL